MWAGKSCKTLLQKKPQINHSIGLDGLNLTASSMRHVLGTGQGEVPYKGRNLGKACVHWHSSTSGENVQKLPV